MKRLPWRSALYLLVLLYLFLDLKACNGPLKRKFAKSLPSSPTIKEKAKKLGWVALVNQEPLTQTQLDLHVSRYLYQRGESWADLTEKNQTMVKRAALRGLIDDVLVRQYCDGEGFVVSEEDSGAFIASWESQFHSETELEERSKMQGLGEAERRMELTRILARKRWLEERIKPGLGVTGEEVRQWFEDAKKDGKYLEPEKIRARHIFLSTVETDDETREKTIRDARKRIVDGEEFSAVAAEVSEDARTKQRGGDLNWFSRARMPDEFTDVVFEQEIGVLGEPFKTKIGMAFG